MVARAVLPVGLLRAAQAQALSLAPPLGPLAQESQLELGEAAQHWHIGKCVGRALPGLPPLLAESRACLLACDSQCAARATEELLAGMAIPNA
eukprot:1215133-Alexandrium_andersonii.AAC.1